MPSHGNFHGRQWEIPQESILGSDKIQSRKTRRNRRKANRTTPTLSTASPCSRFNHHSAQTSAQQHSVLSAPQPLTSHCTLEKLCTRHARAARLPPTDTHNSMDSIIKINFLPSVCLSACFCISLSFSLSVCVYVCLCHNVRNVFLLPNYIRK